MNSDSLAVFIFNKIDGAVNAIGSGIGKGAEFVWPILVKQNLANGIVNIIPFIIVSLFLTWWFMAKYRPYMQRRLQIVNHHPVNNNTAALQVKLDDENFSFWFPAIVFMVLTLISFFFFAHGIKQALNPEYYALQEVINTAKELKN